MNVFDGLADAAFDVVTNTMGYAASWTPSAGGTAKTATVLFKDETETFNTGEMDYQPVEPKMEYRKPYFDGLKQAVDENKKEKVKIIIKGTEYTFLIRRVIAKWDGNTMIAFMDKVDA